MAAFLVEPAEARVQLLEALERREGLRSPVQVALVERHQVENVAILGDLDRQRLGSLQSLLVPAGLQQPTHPTNFQFHGRGERQSKSLDIMAPAVLAEAVS